MENTPIHQYIAPIIARLEPPKSSKPILTPGYELRPCLINMVREQSFLGEGDENPYFHLREFEQTCACLHIASMLDETLRWKVFLFSLTGRAKHWFNQTVGSMQGDWKALCSSFCLSLFPISRVVSLCSEVLSFKQKEKESLSTSWECFKNLINTEPDHAIQDPILLQHFYMGLNKETLKFLDIASGDSFFYVYANLGRSILDKIVEKLIP